MHFITYNKRLQTMKCINHRPKEKLYFDTQKKIESSCTFLNYILVAEYYKFTSYIFMRKNIN